MTESMIVEAVRSVSAQTNAAAATSATTGVAGVDPASVARFQAAMGPTDVSDVDPIPFASELAASWQSAQVNNQGLIHRIRTLSQLNAQHMPTAPDLIELQYEVMNLSFQQEIVTKVADKSSSAIQTLVKNQ
ncbi:MAG: type III secretion system inner rod subunit SctI [Kiritimatiellae bacterium]|nr:type III secretion system inner rod subunit SctI [Kiritimatiellia bacterium]